SLLDEAQRALLAPLLQRARGHHQPARFTDDAFGHAISQEGGKPLHFYFNWHNSEQILDAVPAGRDFFSAEPIPAGKRVLAPYDALVLVSA
nr:alpha-galactosidase [Aeromonadaceae bacterium]